MKKENFLMNLLFQTLISYLLQHAPSKNLSPILLFSSLTVVPAIECDVRAGKINLPEFIVKCPAHCKETKQQVYGTSVYASISSICNAAIHRSELRAENKSQNDVFTAESMLTFVFDPTVSSAGSSPTREGRSSWGRWPDRTSTKGVTRTACALCLCPSGGSRSSSQVSEIKHSTSNFGESSQTNTSSYLFQWGSLKKEWSTRQLWTTFPQDRPTWKQVSWGSCLNHKGCNLESGT